MCVEYNKYNGEYILENALEKHKKKNIKMYKIKLATI